MKYTLQLDIAIPRSQVVALYDNPDNWSRWQSGFVESEHISGQPRQEGAKTKLIQKVGGRTTEIIETIEATNLPDELRCIYEAKGVWNRVVNRFSEIDPAKTRWEFETEFRCTGVVRIMSLLMPGMFRKASLKEMLSFKAFAEGENQDA